MRSELAAFGFLLQEAVSPVGYAAEITCHGEVIELRDRDGGSFVCAQNGGSSADERNKTEATCDLELTITPADGE